eukprot:TRINITY_DN3860_c0_g1_i5.p1 TRINITY_DN3860_c0_g1~~TRINITY_DN3860_c0_g1_i5.p1  ORF type:complete len:199 (+),score=47.22 TRINITY_DN3860_c0_g1_i5:32-628(+)
MIRNRQKQQQQKLATPKESVSVTPNQSAPPTTTSTPSSQPAKRAESNKIDVPSITLNPPNTVPSVTLSTGTPTNPTAAPSKTTAPREPPPPLSGSKSGTKESNKTNTAKVTKAPPPKPKFSQAELEIKRKVLIHDLAKLEPEGMKKLQAQSIYPTLTEVAVNAPSGNVRLKEDQWSNVDSNWPDYTCLLYTSPSPRDS